MTQDKTTTEPPEILIEDMGDKNAADFLTVAAIEVTVTAQAFEAGETQRGGHMLMVSVDAFGRELLVIDRATMSSELLEFLDAFAPTRGEEGE